MSETISFEKESSREERYKIIIPQVRAILSGEEDLIANMANLAAVIKEVFEFLWVGFYIVKDNTLVLGPFQGPLACTRLSFGKGVCGTAWKEKKTVIVPDVDKFPGHISCSSHSRSEIVVPLFDQTQNVWAVLDIDSENLSDFSPTDQTYLEQIVALL